ncbi:MAG: hypothetical protein H7329_00990 [Opitutaceae bacterium]|nr:hypothetical protein [Cytophagales bacterium]
MLRRPKHIIPLKLLHLFVLGIVVFIVGCKTPKYACPAYNEYKHRALADSTDPSNSLKVYYYYLVMEEGENQDSATSATNIEGMTDDTKTNEELLHENDLTKEKEEEWKPYTYFNIRMEVDSMGKPTSFKPIKYKYNGLSEKKKPKNINVDKELSEDKKKSNYIKVQEEEAPLPQ